MLNKLRTILVALALAATLTAVTAAAPPAAAQASIACPANVLCTYWDTNYNGSMYYYSSPYYTCIEIGAPWDNNISSVFNRTAATVRLYQGHNCFGEVKVLQPYNPTFPVWDRDPDLGNPENANDIVSSIRIG